MTAHDELLTTNLAAKVLSVSPRYIAILRDAGKIQPIRISNSRRGIRYSRASIDEFIANQRASSVEARESN